MNEKPPSAGPVFNATTPSEIRNLSPEGWNKANEIKVRATDLKTKCDQHFQKNRGEWIEAERKKVVAKGEIEPRPKGAPPPDPLQKATRNVQMRHAQRVGRIMLAERKMIRDIPRGEDLGR